MPYHRDREEKKRRSRYRIMYTVYTPIRKISRMRPDYLVLNETRMDSDSLVSLNNYDLVHHKKREPGRTAGGVAIYRHTDCLTNAVAIPDVPNIEKLV